MGIRVVSTTEQGAGQGYDLTDDVEGLGWSSVNPGGDESCTFTLKRSWFANSPEIERGNLLRVMDGVDVLWQGRVEETDRSGEDTEQIGVTAYGLGVRLKDTTMQEIYVDPDHSRWGSIPNDRIVALEAAFPGLYLTDMGNTEVRPSETGTSKLALIFTRLANGLPPVGRIEAWYDANGIEIGSVLYSQEFGQGGAWQLLVFAAKDQVVSAFDQSANLAGANGSGTLSASPDRHYAGVLLEFSAAKTLDGEWRADLVLAVVGRHGLTLQGTTERPSLGVSQMIQDAVGRAAGITIRRVDPTSFLSERAVYFKRTKVEDVIVDLNRYEAHRRTWGTWGPDSPLDRSTDGYFDYRSIDEEASWIAFRAECDSCNLRSEMASLFDTVHVDFTDNSNVQRTVTASREVAELNGVPREETIDGGKMTEAGAEALAEATLALSGGFAPARGTIVRSQPILHVERGLLPAHYLRANGSSIRVPDVLPSSTLFSLDSTPDRRTTFPIKRVSVDASSRPTPVTTVELDQTNEALSALQAQLAQNAEVRGG